MSMRTTSQIASLSFVLALGAVGCRSGNTTPGSTNNNNGNGTDNGTGNDNGGNDVDCPGDAISVCDLQNLASPLHPNVDDPIELTGLLVTTPTISVSEREGVVTVAGFYVQDTSLRDTLNGRFSGILVTYLPNSVAGAPPLAGDIVDLSGQYAEFGRDGFEKQRQIQASRITATGMNGTIEPTVISDATTIGNGGSATDSFEGVLVRVEAVTITNTDVMINNMPYFGAFEIENTLIVSGDYYSYRQPQTGETFTSITGILRLGTAPFNSGQYLLSPRIETDVVSQNQAVVVRTIGDVQDPSSPGYPSERCENVSGQTAGKCAVAELTNMVVTAGDGYISRNLRSLWIEDPNDADKRFAAVKVVYNPGQLPYVPEPGHIVNVRAEMIEFRGGTQLQFPEFTRVNTETASITPTLIANPCDIGRKNPDSNVYEGQLVCVENATVGTFCVEDTRGRDHGNWYVDCDVMVGSAFMYGYNGDLRPSEIQCLDANEDPTGLCGCNTPSGGTSRPGDQRENGDSFAKICGVLDFAFGDYQVQSRGDFDLMQN